LSSHPNGPDTSPPSIPPGEYRKLVIEACQKIGPILASELRNMVESGMPPLETSAMQMALIVVGNLQQSAEFLDQQAMDLTIAKNPGLVDPEGNPLSSRAKRRLEKEAAQTIPSFEPVENPEA
jgi:hypothetical protein